MMTLIQDGGFPMVAILVLGALTLASAFVFAVRPVVANERFISWMGIAMAASILSGVCSDLATTLATVAREDDMPLEMRLRIAMKGTAESMAPAIVGFAVLSLVALMLAVGKRRLDAKAGARA